MTQPIDPHRVDAWRRVRESEDPTPAVPPRTRRDASDLPALPDVHADLLARATRSASAAASPPRPLLAGLIDASPTIRQGTPTQKRLDDFLESARPTFHTPNGDVTVSIGFWMGGPVKDPVLAQRIADNAVALAPAARAAGLSDHDVRLARDGRASPQLVRKLTQALIAGGRLPPGRGDASSLSARVREMMRDHGIGIDCAGYVQQALLVAVGVTRERAHLKPDIREDDLSGLAARGYRRVPENELRAGDVIALDPRSDGRMDPHAHPVGHRVIVFDQHMADAAELADLCDASKDPDVQRAVAGGKVRVLVVDSSWGAGPSPTWGGVDRRTWYHDEANKVWIWRTNAGNVVVTERPYDHPLEGMYRLKGAQP